MAASFIGLEVTLTLKTPPGTILRGLITNVVGQTLHLQNGMYSSSVCHDEDWEDLIVGRSKSNATFTATLFFLLKLLLRKLLKHQKLEIGELILLS